VTKKCWIIVVYSKAWVSLNCSHEEEGIIIIIGPFLDGNVTSQPATPGPGDRYF
jgi:hypothetical protein